MEGLGVILPNDFVIHIFDKLFGGNEIITYLCNIILKDIDYARNTENVWDEVLFLFT